MRVLVTGGAGYIGCVLVPEMLRRGHQVRVLDKCVFGTEGLAALRDQIEFVVDDIRTVDPSVMEGIEAVVHLAGLSNDPTAEFDPAANLAINATATIELARMSKAAGVRRFLFGSSCSVYYTLQPSDAVLDEDHPVDPRAPYSFSKREAEKGLMVMADERFVPVIFRQGTLFGWSPRMRYDLVVNSFTKDAFESRRMTVHAGGQMWRPMLHIADAVEAYLAGLEAPLERGPGLFNVLSGNFQVLDMAYAVRRALGPLCLQPLEVVVQEVGVTRSYRVSSELFEKSFGLALRRGIEPAVVEMWERLEACPDPEDPIHYNIRWLKLLTRMKERLDRMGGSPL